MHLRLLVELAGLYEKLGHPHQAIEKLERAVSEEPTHEASNESLMRLYADSGRRQKALEKFEQLSENLRKLGYKPALSTHRLRRAISEGEPLAGGPLAGGWGNGASGSTALKPTVFGPNNLPRSQTSFVGWRHELSEFKRSLMMTDLLTLTGPGGSGKTRLALEAARALDGVYQDGVWLVELAPLTDPALVPEAVTRVLGMNERPGGSAVEALLEHLRDKKLLPDIG